MTHRSPRRIVTVLLTVAAATVALAQPASAAPYAFAGPVFGLAAGPGDVLFAADAGAGIVRLQGGEGELVVELPGVTDIAPVKPGRMWAIAGRKLFTVNHGKPHFLAGLGKFERIVNPDGGEVDSNPFDVTAFGTKRALIADAGANAVLVGEPARRRQLDRDAAGRAGSDRQRQDALRMSGRAGRDLRSARRDPRAGRGDERRDRSGRRVLRLGAEGVPGAARHVAHLADRARRASRALRRRT